MVLPADTSPSAWRQVWAWLRAAPWAALTELACRAGYVARGAVYLSVGLAGLLAAMGLTPHATGALGALQAWATWPFGVFVLWLADAGLWGFAGWRFLQSVLDVDRQGRSAKALFSRGGQLISGLVYAGLALSLSGVLQAFDELREIDDRARTQALVQTLLQMPAGAALVIAAGLFILAAGLGNIAQASFARFSQRLTCPRQTRLPAALLGRLGYLARGIAFLPAGGYMLLAGLHARATEAQGIGGALEVLETLPMGRLVMAAISIGLGAFGAYALFEARFRPITIADDQRTAVPGAMRTVIGSPVTALAFQVEPDGRGVQ